MDAENMTNTQLYLVIGIPGLLSLVGILLNAALYLNFSTTLNARMTSFETSINARMTSFETSMNARMAALESSMNARMAGMEARIGGIEARIGGIEARMLNLENTFTTRFDLLMGRLTDLENEIHRSR